jgi:hypothetical protein
VSTTPNPRLDWALYLAGRGWPVFPLLPGAKQPAIRDWEHRASTDPDRITAFWSTHPAHNIGLPAGRAGLLVVDLDMPRPDHTPPADERRRGAVSGAQVLTHLARQAHATIPDTWTVFTPSGGTHLYFAQPAGHALRNTAGTVGPLVDTRGHGGYVVAPGSVTADGGYELTVDVDPVELPGWLVRVLTVRPATASTEPRRIAAANVNAWVAAALAGEERRVCTAPSGGHNKAQAIAAYNLGRLVGGGHLTREHAHRVLSSAVEPHLSGSCRCTQTGVARVIDWGLDNGARRPRHLDTEGSAA